MKHQGIPSFGTLIIVSRHSLCMQ